MASEWREERCEECGAMCERRWIVRTHRVHTAIPAGFHVESRSARSGWTEIAGPTSDVSVCLCDAP